MPWSAMAAILALGSCGLWTWFLLEGIDMIGSPVATLARKARLAGAGACIVAAMAAAWFLWNMDPMQNPHDFSRWIDGLTR